MGKDVPGSRVAPKSSAPCMSLTSVVDVAWRVQCHTIHTDTGGAALCALGANMQSCSTRKLLKYIMYISGAFLPEISRSSTQPLLAQVIPVRQRRLLASPSHAQCCRSLQHIVAELDDSPLATSPRDPQRVRQDPFRMLDHCSLAFKEVGQELTRRLPVELPWSFP